MHQESLDFISFIAKHLKEHFNGVVNVLDIGSGDINGNLKRFFGNEANYKGNDVYPGKNVDIVSKTSELPFFAPTFDTIISSECFEHDPEYKDSFKKIVEILKPGGLFLFTCASTGRPEHGTRKTSPLESLGAKANLSKFRDYYKNLTFEDLNLAVNVNSVFSHYAAYYNKKHCDLYFFGIKKTNKLNKIINIPEYLESNTEKIIIFPEILKQQTEKVAEKVAEKTAEKTAEKVAEKSIQDSSEKIVEKITQKTFFISSEPPEFMKENIAENKNENLEDSKKSNPAIQTQNSVIMLSTEPPNLQPPQIQQEQPSKYFNQGVIRLSTSPPE